MKQDNFKKQLVIYLAIIFLFNAGLLFAQEGGGTQDAGTEFELRLENSDGAPVTNAMVYGNEGSLVFFPDNDGRVKVAVEQGSVLLIEGSGWASTEIDLSKDKIPSVVVLEKAAVYLDKNETLGLPMGMEVSRRNNTGAISKVDVEKLKHYPDPLLSNTMQGLGLGLTVVMNAGGMNNNPAALYLRGLPRMSGNEVLTIVDGIERPINDLIPEEIESIELLKDATSKIAYGSRAANGILMITTRRGEANRRVIKASADYGIGQATRLPDFINSYDYSRLYNEARLNDGLTPLYSEEDIEGYKNSSGPNDFRYPDVDYHDYFLKSYTNYSKFTTEFSGGNKGARYAAVGGFLQSKGLEAEGRTPTNTRFNFRGNLDVKINEMISGNMGVAVVVDNRERASLNHSEVFSALSSHRPNEYPVIIDEGIMPKDSLGTPALGTSFDKSNNLYGDLKYGGYNKAQYISGQTNFGLDFDLGSVVEGLEANAYVTFDNYFFGSEVQNKSAATYARRFIQTPEGEDSIALFELNRANYNDDIELASNENYRNAGYFGGFSYNNSFGVHELDMDLGYFFFQREVKGIDQDLKTANTYFRTNYAFDNRYVAELGLSYMGSDKFDEGNRYELFPAAGLGWVVSEEDFMAGNNIFDYLKLKASAGILGYDASTPHYLYEKRWEDTGNVSFGEQNNNNQGKVSFGQEASPGLDWEKSREINVGLEGVGFNYKLMFELNYFNELRYDIIQYASAEYPELYGKWYPYKNIGEVKNQGIELQVNWQDQIEAFSYSIGANVLWSKNEIIEQNEVDHPDQYLRTTGESTDAMYGYVSEGLFGKGVDIDGHPHQAFGDYQDGDIAYKDLNNDGIIDNRDQKMLGNSFPRTSLGLDISLKYKGWGLYALGTASLGMSSWLNNSYYWMNGEGKYSSMAMDRYHSANNPGGNYPRLTTTSGSNNYRNSDFWMENTSFFRLKNLELSYTFNNRNMSALARKVKIYARGSNLLVVSEVDDLDPEALNAGVNNYPVLSFITGGISVSF
ncbi:SusC/RagA family TonB-linked outer membrane protein [Marinilabilia rubra]|uniref:SusC/RagA family TonB-linked outer membrane protein n=1 Tax=Marinilabilia rubra TaxID=2162893 RepID=A0A2U2BE96_9BACT|nr:SusC/RagA family TonB-linked outer membrane protein [Marinilabilia rubra]PWE01378.1 SusC/RagA family TonB-linked outer membrane protein [Marinilabilia rubra]